MSKEENQMPTTFPEKYSKILKDNPEFLSISEAASEAELKALLLTCEGDVYNVENFMMGDEKLLAAKALVKDYAAPYRDSLKVLTAKIKYCLFLLEGKGVEVGTKE